MKFVSRRYPRLIVWSSRHHSVVARFVDGEFETDDQDAVEVLSHIDGVEPVGGKTEKRPRRGKDAKDEDE